MVTGAAQGIGLAIAEAFLSERAALFLLDRDGPLLEKEAKRLQRQGQSLAYAEADITDAEAIESTLSAAASSIGPINALVNNAGVNVFSEPLEMSNADWQRCFDINLRGAWNCCKAVLPSLIEQGGGAILNIASTHAFTIIPHTFPYPVAKHALIGMTKALGIEYASKGVRVNAPTAVAGDPLAHCPSNNAEARGGLIPIDGRVACRGGAGFKPDDAGR
ncbi:SDR family NAD(P)-dependent oxidoreductase [Sinorhizobium meliloti]|nr:SDR family NAD(P)-dependent oxidoreductase [Sinorhizobium meliloti]